MFKIVCSRPPGPQSADYASVLPVLACAGITTSRRAFLSVRCVWSLCVGACHALHVLALLGVVPRLAVCLHASFREECLKKKKQDLHLFRRSSRNICSSRSMAVGGARPYLCSASVCPSSSLQSATTQNCGFRCVQCARFCAHLHHSTLASSSASSSTRFPFQRTGKSPPCTTALTVAGLQNTVGAALFRCRVKPTFARVVPPLRRYFSGKSIHGHTSTMILLR